MPKGKGYGKRRSKFLPKGVTGGSIAKKGGSAKKAFKDIGKLRKKKGR